MSHWEAAQMVGQIGPKAAIPCHYDMFPDNSADPLQFRASLRLKRCVERGLSEGSPRFINECTPDGRAPTCS